MRLALILTLVVAARAQPGIRQNGVVNAASRIPPGLAGGAIAQGALFTVFGVRLGSQGHTRVMVASHGKSLEVRLVSAAKERIEAQMPPAVPTGAAKLVVNVDGVASAPFPLEVAAQNPGLFSRNGLGWGPGRVDNIAAGARTENSSAHSAHPGQRVRLTGTGFGNLMGYTVVVGRQPVRLTRPGAIRAQEDIELALPATVPEGCFVPVYVLAGPDRASNVVTMSISSGNGPCRAAPIPLVKAGTAAVVVVSRTRSKMARGNQDSFDDEATAVFASSRDEPLQSPLLLLPPAGTCSAYTGSFQDDTVLPQSIQGALIPIIQERGLDAGPQLRILRKGQMRIVRMENGVQGYYRGRLGQAGPAASRRAPPLFLEPGDLTLLGTGGKDAGPFETHFPAPAPFTWTNRDSLTAVDRSRTLTVQWSPAPGRTMIVFATNVDQLTTAMGMCLCVANGAAGSFAVPPALLANLPLSRDLPGIKYNGLFLASIQQPAPLKAAGVGLGIALSIYASGRSIPYR